MPDPVDWIGRLASRCDRFAQVVEEAGWRSDVRERRAKLLLVLLSKECPQGCPPKRRWYVPGAVARLGPAGIARVWKDLEGAGPPPCERTIRSHLAALERAGLIVRSPGDWIPGEFGEDRRPRYASTIWLIRNDLEAQWWERVGWPRLRSNPGAKCSPSAWRRLFESWRREARSETGQLLLPFTDHQSDSPSGGGLHPLDVATSAGSGRPEPEPAPTSQAVDELAAAVERDAEPLELLRRLRTVGARLWSQRSFEVTKKPTRLRGAAALLVRALRRGDEIPNPGGWLYTRWQTAPAHEFALAVRALCAHGPTRSVGNG